MWVLSWARRLVLWVKAISHVLHTKGFSPVWILWCTWRSEAWKKPLPHSAQIYVLSLSCLFWWTLNREEYLKVLGHLSHLYTSGALRDLSWCFPRAEVPSELWRVETGPGVTWSRSTSMRTSWEEGPFRDPSWGLEGPGPAPLLEFRGFSRETPPSSSLRWFSSWTMIREGIWLLGLVILSLFTEMLPSFSLPSFPVGGEKVTQWSCTQERAHMGHPSGTWALPTHFVLFPGMYLAWSRTEFPCSPLLLTTDWLDERWFLLRTYFLKRGLPAPACGHGPIKKKKKKAWLFIYYVIKPVLENPPQSGFPNIFVLWAPIPLCPALISACIKFHGNFFFSVCSMMKKDEYCESLGLQGERRSK